MEVPQKNLNLSIHWPFLVNWDRSLIATGPELFRATKVRYEGGRLISYPQSAKGDQPILWVLSLDALFFEFRQTHFTNQWAMWLKPVIRLVRSWGEFLPARRITVRELRHLLSSAQPDNPHFNTREMLEEIMKSKSESDYLTEQDMINFQCLKDSSERGVWPE
jgi:hypothetical protein